MLTRREPCRALPVPFCLNIFAWVPWTSLRSLVLAVPARALARCQRTTSHRRCSLTSAANTSSATSISATPLPSRSITLSLAMASGTSGLDLDVHASRQVELHQRVEGLLVGLDDVEQPLVCADLELLARLLVDERSTKDRVLVDLGRLRDRSHHLGPGPPSGLGGLGLRLPEQLVVVGL